jgi:protocatechuate 3,4-dioxygenase beta subunit
LFYGETLRRLRRHSLAMANSHLTRREALRLLSGTALALAGSRLAFARKESIADASIPVNRGPASFSRLSPELTEGPFYIDLEQIRRDITEGKPGVPLRLRIMVMQVTSGAPIPGAAVDIWHCDAQGVYSGFNNPLRPPPTLGDNGMPPPPPRGFPPTGQVRFGPGPMGGRKPDNAQTFLRGVQLTDATGRAEIDTIVPGWYPGRAAHIHVRVHNGGFVANGRYRKGHINHTGQIFMAESFTDRIYQLPAYIKHSGKPVALEQDEIFRQSGQQLARITPVDSAQPHMGFYSDSILVIDPAATPGPG